jgi:hypothetical protein
MGFFLATVPQPASQKFLEDRNKGVRGFLAPPQPRTTQEKGKCGVCTPHNPGVLQRRAKGAVCHSQPRTTQEEVVGAPQPMRTKEKGVGRRIGPRNPGVIAEKGEEGRQPPPPQPRST